LKATLAVARRELVGLTKAPTAWLFLIVFSALASLVVIGQEHLFDRRQADLAPLFRALPWLCLVLLPTLSMGLFSEERRAGSIELLLTLPLSIAEVVVGKFLAALGFASLALAGTLPLWIAITTFGEPDHGALLAGYFGALLLTATLLAIGTYVSALTKSPAAAFVGRVSLGFAFLFSDLAALRDVLPDWFASATAQLSLAARYEALSRGVIGLGDVLFFVGTTAAFLFATGLVLVHRRRGRFPTALAVTLLGHYAVLVFGLAPLARGLALDCTEGQLYSLSPTTRAIAADLDQPLTFTLYVAEEAAATSPRFVDFTRFVEDQLHDLASAANGQIRIVKKDVAPFSDADDEARAAGLSHVQLGVGGGGRELVFGLVAANAAGDQRSLAFISPEAEAELEHHLARLTLELSHPERPQIGLISSFTSAAEPGDPLTGGLAGRGWQVVEATRAEFDYKRLTTPLSGVPAAIDILWVLHPKSLDRMTLASIDRFARAGGALLFQGDPLAVVYRTGMQGTETTAGYVAERDSDVPELLEAWGLRLVPRRVLADRHIGRKLPPGSVGNSEPVTFPHWLALGPADFESSPRLDSLFANLRGINFASVGVLAELEVDGALEVYPLLRTSEDSMRLEASQVQVIQDPASLLRDFVPSGKRQAFGVELIGDAPAAFPDEVVINPKPMRAVVIADVDCAADVLWVRAKAALPGAEAPGGFVAVADNGVFLSRLFEELSGGAALGLAGERRAGARYTRPFTRFDQLESAAEERLARKLEGARNLEAELRERLAAASEAYAASGGTAAAPPEIAKLREELGQARAQLKQLLRERSSEVDRLQAKATYWCALAWPMSLLLLGLYFRRRP
jgi:ABC-type uncharacterized transport system involved in gliding motility auxiliary subunit/ABC-type transport system involved in cytochrome c biogenesis permease component